MKILVVRFRQMGDAVLATPLLSTLRANFPDAEIDFVLNERIAPLFRGYPAISRIISFSEAERHSVFAYVKKVWHTMHDTHYDVVIDMRSTVNTMCFALFSLSSKFRIGIRKPYTWCIFNYRYEGCEDDESMISHNLQLAEPLKKLNEDGRVWKEDRNLSLSITAKEEQDFREYMIQQGIDFSRPVMLVGVTAKLQHKTWPEDRMTELLRRFLATYPDVQLIFNFAPGQEAENARRIYDALAQHGNIFINIEAPSMRQLAAMAANCTAYFGNEGGGRHIVHAMGRPSLVICSPTVSKTTWLPQDTDILAVGIDASDYSLISVDRVWTELQQFCITVIK